MAAAGPTSWLKGGLGKFRYGNGGAHLRFAAAVVQADWAISEEWDAVGVLRAEPLTPGVVDALEAYLLYTPASEGAVSWSVKSGAFGHQQLDRRRAAQYRQRGHHVLENHVGTLSLIAAVICCNDEAGILMAVRGWAYRHVR